jgi:S-adenosylmethionine:tRNA ribosyltransferase-isomerase
MHLREFDYDLPEELIAQHPLQERAASRLMVVDRRRSGGAVAAHGVFRDLPRYLDQNDVVVVNRSRVVPARLLLRRASGGEVEVLYLRARGTRDFDAWVRPAARLHPGEVLSCGDGRFRFRFVSRTSQREALVRFEPADGVDVTLEAALESVGHVPLPPYIRRPDEPVDRTRYQTVYAREGGSVAAPTAGLHFDEPLMSDLSQAGVTVVPLVLHVGPGTFSPLDEEEVEANDLQSEAFLMPAQSIADISRAREAGKRIVAVGTTVTRALESADAMGWFDSPPPAHGRAAATNLFIYPGYEFRIVQRLITNFHLPRSSLLLLVCAFAGRERTLECYRQAVDRGYRFYSYGDAMLIL